MFPISFLSWTLRHIGKFRIRKVSKFHYELCTCSENSLLPRGSEQCIEGYVDCRLIDFHCKDLTEVLPPSTLLLLTVVQFVIDAASQSLMLLLTINLHSYDAGYAFVMR